jgi:hypothetical protein
LDATRRPERSTLIAAAGIALGIASVYALLFG